MLIRVSDVLLNLMLQIWLAILPKLTTDTNNVYNDVHTHINTLAQIHTHYYIVFASYYCMLY